MVIEAEPKRPSEQPLIISLQNGRNLFFPDKKWYPITRDIALALDEMPRNIKRQLDRIIENDPSIEVTTVRKLIDSGRASELNPREQYKTIMCDRNNLIKIMQAYPLTEKVNGQPHEDSPEDRVNPTDAVSEEWWEDNMPDKEAYATKDFWDVLKQQKGKENLTPNNVSIQITKHARLLKISGQRIPKSRGFYYEKKDAQRLMNALLAVKPGTRKWKSLYNPINSLKAPSSEAASTEPIRLFSDEQDGHEEDPEKISTDDMKNIKKQLIEDFAALILSKLAFNPDGLNGLGHKPHTLLFNALRLISKSVELSQIIQIGKLEMFFAESFIKRLEEVWNKPYNPRQSVKEQRTISYCNDLKQQGKTKEELIQAVRNHFSVPIPEKSDNKQYFIV